MKIHPFRGYSFDPGKVPNLSDVVTQPYDKISPEMQGAYYEKHPNNIVRVILNRGEGDRKYADAASSFEGWIEEGVIVRDAEPAIYASYQEYRDEAGEKRVRKGFVALLELEEFGSGVRPHEKTLAGPKADRLNLLRATRANFGQIFMLYSDPALAVNEILDRFTAGAPAHEAVDEAGEVHRLWAVRDPEAVARITGLVSGLEAFIADGHHRYETALNFRREMLEAGARCEGLETFEQRMVTLVNMDDAGLTVFPTHRVVHSADPKRVKALAPGLLEDFDVREFPFDAGNEAEVRASFLGALRAQGPGEHLVGMALRDEQVYRLLSLKGEHVVDAFYGDSHSAGWKRLDVSVLHGPILEKRLGIDAAALEKEANIAYVRGADKALERLREPGNQAVFLLNGTKVSEVRAVAQAGERMPQKSTDFYPKLLTGMVINKLNPVQGA